MSIPTDQKKIRAAIRRYGRKFEKEPDFRDGGGTRFLIGPYYLLIGDAAGATKHYRWFEENFPDSSDEPFHTLSWALALYRTGQPEEAVYRLKRVHLANPYILPAILNIPHGQPDVRRGSNWHKEDYVAEAPPEFLRMWTESERRWLQTVWDNQEFKALVKEHVKLVSALSDEPVGPRRSELVGRLFSLLPERERPQRADKGRASHLTVIK